jgi:hypothetical protein
VQSCQELEDQKRATLQRLYETALLGSRGFDESQLSERLVRRATGYEQEAAEVGHGPSATPLGDVGDDRLRRTHQLIGAGKCARTAECSR